MTRACRRCDWRDTTDQAAQLHTEHAADTGHPICVVDNRTSLEQHQPQVCARCSGRARADLADIVNLAALLPAELGRLRSSTDYSHGGRHSTESPLPGGNALVLLGPGSAAAERRRAYLRGDDDLWEADDQTGDVPSAAYELGQWEDQVRTAMGHPAATRGATVTGAARYLNEQLTWVLNNHPAADEFCHDLRNLRSQLQHATGRSTAPKQDPVPCLDCGGRLEQHYEDARTVGRCAGHDGRCAWPRTNCCDVGGLIDDQWVCRGCRRTYDLPAYHVAMHERLRVLAEAQA